jgi:hypothetical protein
MVLALLALHRGEPVSADRRIDALWGGGQVANPVNALQFVAEDREQLIFDGLGAGYRKCADEQVTGVVHEPSLAGCSAGRCRIRRPLTSFYCAERAGVRIPQPDRVDTSMQLEFAKKLHLIIAVEMRKCYVIAA